MKGQNYFFCGIGGNGMSPLARLLVARGAVVAGSDRSYDTGTNPDFFARLKAEGIALYPQNGSGVSAATGEFIVTRAVEPTIPDVARAKELKVPVLRRPELMARIFATSQNIAVGGTSGKSTTTAMIGFILERLGRDPTIVDGAEMINFGSHLRVGQGEHAVFEADESDGLNDVIALCPAAVAVLTNISLDHFELAELGTIFGQFIARASQGAVLNHECPHSMALKSRATKPVVTFGRSKDADINPHTTPIALAIPGAHNVENALAAIAAVSLLGIAPREAAAALKEFTGIRRRLERVATVAEINVFDDFASNPGKITATLRTLRELYPRTIALFQPHGFQPTKMMKDGYIETFSSELRPDDRLLLLPIYYAGGAANLVGGKVIELPKDISSADLLVGITPRHKHATLVATRTEALAAVAKLAQAGDAVVIMGSRDETLPQFARAIAAQLHSR